MPRRRPTDREGKRHQQRRARPVGVYDAAWRKLRKYKLELQPRCEGCGELAQEVHHVKEIREHPELRLKLENLESLCRSCHNKIGYGMGSIQQWRDKK